MTFARPHIYHKTYVSMLVVVPDPSSRIIVIIIIINILCN